MRHSPPWNALWLLIVCSILETCAVGQSYDPGAAFSRKANPSGVWTYGYSTTYGGDLIPHRSSDFSYGFPAWRTDIAMGDPFVGYNPSDVWMSFSTLRIGPGEILLHPGVHGEYAVLRFTAPMAGDYKVTGSFFGRDSTGTTTDVHGLANGTSAFDGLVMGYGESSTYSFDATVGLPEGGHFDFAVGYGINQNLLWDSTGFVGLITAVPEPSTLGLLAVGIAWMYRMKRCRPSNQ